MNKSNEFNQSSSEGQKLCLVGRNEGSKYGGLLKSPDPGNLKKMYTIVVEGNVASGKTTFVNLFRGYQQVNLWYQVLLHGNMN